VAVGVSGSNLRTGSFRCRELSPAQIRDLENTRATHVFHRGYLLTMFKTNLYLRSPSIPFFRSISECSNIFLTFGILSPNEWVQLWCVSYTRVPPLCRLPHLALLAWYVTMQGPGSRRGSISTTDELELHRLLKPENSLPSRPSTLFESSYAISVHESSISPGSQSYASFVDESILPWWEAEAEDILRGIDLQTIRLLCRYRLYKDSSIPASIPRTRWTPILNSFLLQLGVGTYSRSDIDNLDLDQKAKELLTRLEPSIPDDDGPWGCLPSSAAFFQLDASQVASKLNEESLSLFKNITFLNHVRKALYPGETIDPVEAFKGWHDDLFHLVLGRLKSFPAEEEKFVQIKQVRIILLRLSPR